MDIFWTSVAMLMCLVAEAFFTGSEIGIVSADKMKLRHRASQGSKGAELALKMLDNPEWLLSTTLIGTNIAVVANTTLATALVIELFGQSYSWVAIVIVAPLIWVFGEIVPKSIFQQQSDKITPIAIYPLRFFSFLFYPVLVVFSKIIRFFTKVVGGGEGEKSPFTLRQQIMTMLQMPAQDGDIQPAEKTMISRMFNFSETTAQEVMVPLVDVIAIEKGANCGQARKLATQSNHVRLPVYDKRIDQIIGLIHTLELLGANPGKSIQSHIRPVRYIPATKSVQTLLFDLRQDGDVMAVIVDEFGGATGIITIEDIMEEVVEEMEDEYDTKESPNSQWVHRLGERDYLVSARIDLDNLKEQLGIELPKGKYSTLAGFLLDRACEVPSEGTVIQVHNMSFTFQRSNPRIIKEVRIRWQS